MNKYSVTLSVDEDWIKEFDLIVEAIDESEAEALAMMSVRENLSDYIIASAEKFKRREKTND
tara:strand:- start:1131 stop:1316 length:186 start_codon:yes stop_codon:yes gene_type:complete